MSPELARDAHSLEVPDHHGTINAPGGEVVPVAVEAHACRMAGSDGVGYVLGVVLEEIIV